MTARDGSSGTPARSPRRPYRVIDSDVHHTLPDWETLQPYLQEPWRSKILQPNSHVGGLGLGAGRNRLDSVGPDGGRPASDPAFTIQQLIVENHIDVAVLTGNVYGWNVHPNPEYANAVMTAFNDWTIDHWLAPHPQFRGSITVNSNDPEAAAAEIDRLGERDDMVMAIIGGTSTAPYGQKFYHPIYEAAVRHGLPIGIHVSAAGTGLAPAVSAVGTPRTFFEYHSGLPRIYITQLISLIAEGVFEKYPRLRWLFIEGGVAWLPHVMWRLDKEWRALRREVPWVKRPPSEVIREHCFFTTQPLEEPPDPRLLVQILEMIDGRNCLLYSSDYPHWDYDAVHVLNALPADYQPNIFQRNAERLFGL
jgi:predicted TIM-barrel fold metal-dependent hydrolase